MKRASIDLGTNTCLLLVVEEGPQGLRVLHDESNVVRLGQGVAASGLLQPEAMERARACLGKYAAIAQSHGVAPADILAVGTAQARDARNAAEYFDSIASELGIRFRILTGDEEARATFLGARLEGMDARRMVVMDIGGGSTEIVAMPDPEGGMLGTSLGVGAVKITERHFRSDPVTDAEFWAAEDAINQVVRTLGPWREELGRRLARTPAGGDPVFVAVAGTAVTLAMLQNGVTEFDSSRIDGLRIRRGDAHRLVEELKWRSVEERKLMPGMEQKRADVILAGALIFWRVMEELDFKEAVISTRGLRYGVLEVGCG
jgi:exopolyphosphatase/guanosine-5'-triphosphate,3'-diphosphate pyrophosphatase